METPHGRLVALELKNFKSYMGEQTIVRPYPPPHHPQRATRWPATDASASGTSEHRTVLVFSQGPFKRFTAIVGPNGAGKSNLMDAISFVLGVRTMQLRGQQLRDLIFRKEGEETVERDAYVKLSFAKASAAEEGEEEDDDEDDEAAEILTFARKISSSGASSYVLNGRTVTWERYSKALAEIGVNVTSRKFLVFQGDVESIAGMAPRELTTYFEKVSGSDELRDAYGSAEASKNQSRRDDHF